MENDSFGGIKVMAYINDWNTLILARSQVKKVGRTSLKQYCLTDTGDEAENERRKRLLEEYSDKNKERINRISSGSNKKVWWKCREAGHEWETMVSTRSKLKSNCPFCCGQRVTIIHRKKWNIWRKTAERV